MELLKMRSAKRRLTEAASFTGLPFDRLMEVQSRPFSIKLSEDAGLPFSMPRRARARPVDRIVYVSTHLYLIRKLIIATRSARIAVGVWCPSLPKVLAYPKLEITSSS